MTGADEPLRLVLLLEDLDFGGTQRYALHLAAGLDLTRFRTVIWTLRGGSGFAAEAAARGLEVVNLTQSRRVGPLAILRLALRLRREPPDLLYTLTVLPNIWGRLAAGLLGIPVVSGYRNFRPRQHDRLLHRFSARIIANAERLRDVLVTELGVPAARVAVVPNGVDVERFSPEGRAEAVAPLILCVARRAPIKDLPTLVEAFRLLRADMPEARLRIIGDGPVELTAAENLELCPGSSDVRAALSEAWVFALSSLNEGAPNAVLEAMASAVPVVATNCGGVPEIVVEGHTGLLVPPRDPQALAKALAKVLRDEGLRRRMGEAARARALEKYSIAGMVTATENVLALAAGRSGNLSEHGSAA